MAAGLAAAQFLTAVFALRSYHNIILLACLLAVGFAMMRSFMFLYRLSRDSKEQVVTELTARDVRWLFVPVAVSALVYSAIAPNYRLAVFFVVASAPHLLCLLYLIKRYAYATSMRAAFPLPSFETIGVQILTLVPTIIKIIPDSISALASIQTRMRERRDLNPQPRP